MSTPTASAAGPLTLSDIAAKLDICITRTEVAIRNSDRAASAAERTEAHVATMKRIVLRVQNDQTSMRYGFPTTWAGRVAIVIAAALAGAVAAGVTVGACVQPAAAAPVPLAPLSIAR